MLTSAETWAAIASKAPSGTWLTLADIYDVVRENSTLDPVDESRMSARSRSPRWKRTVRNVLQRKKQTGAIEWDGAGRYRLP
jgi:hypothetical protein